VNETMQRDHDRMPGILPPESFTAIHIAAGVPPETRGAGRKMVVMRARNTGSFDHKIKTWRLRGKGIHAGAVELIRSAKGIP
jgi:hypothetical protein